MRTNFLRCLLALVIALLSGCASVGEGQTYADVRVNASPTHKARAYIYRKYAEPIVWSMTVYFGNHEVAALRQGTFTWVNLAPGKHQVRGVWPGLSGQQDASIEIEAKAATTYYLEVTGISQGVPGLGGALGTQYPLKIGSGINQVSPEAADATLATCCTFRKPTATDY